MTIGLHATWMVNSLTHFLGQSPVCYSGRLPKQLVRRTVEFRRGWHNNHHADPTSARHGLAWYEIDMSWLAIRSLEIVGLAKSVQVARLKLKLE